MSVCACIVQVSFELRSERVKSTFLSEAHKKFKKVWLRTRAGMGRTKGMHTLYPSFMRAVS